MTKAVLAWIVCLALLPLLGAAQKPPPPTPPTPTPTPAEEPAEESPAEESSPAVDPDLQEEPAPEEAESPETGSPETGLTEDESEVQDEGEAETDRVLTPKEEEIRRKAAKKAAEREERREKRAAKQAEEEAKQAEKAAQQQMKKEERIAELVELGQASIEAERYKEARGQFEKIREIEGGKSFASDMGIARLELALGNYAQAVQVAQRAVTATSDRERKVEALTLAGEATLAARPMLEDDPDTSQPGTEMFVDTALRFFVRAVELAPLAAAEALAHLESRFPGSDPEARTARLLQQYFEQVAGAEVQHGRRVAAAYEVLLGGQPEPGKPLAVVGPITPPKRATGDRPSLEAREGAPSKRRLAVSFVIEADGTVSEVGLLSKVAAEMRPGVTRTLRSWTFEPARLPDGTAVAAFWLQGVNLTSD